MTLSFGIFLTRFIYSVSSAFLILSLSNLDLRTRIWRGYMPDDAGVAIRHDIFAFRPLIKFKSFQTPISGPSLKTIVTRVLQRWIAKAALLRQAPKR